jgi:hypothetical protein
VSASDWFGYPTRPYPGCARPHSDRRRYHAFCRRTSATHGSCAWAGHSWGSAGERSQSGGGATRFTLLTLGLSLLHLPEPSERTNLRNLRLPSSYDDYSLSPRFTLIVVIFSTIILIILTSICVIITISIIIVVGASYGGCRSLAILIIITITTTTSVNIGTLIINISIIILIILIIIILIILIVIIIIIIIIISTIIIIVIVTITPARPQSRDEAHSTAAHHEGVPATLLVTTISIIINIIIIIITTIIIIIIINIIIVIIIIIIIITIIIITIIIIIINSLFQDIKQIQLEGNQ